MTYVICEPCIGVCDKSCVEECPVDCIQPRDGYEDIEGKKLYIDPATCIAPSRTTAWGLVVVLSAEAAHACGQPHVPHDFAPVRPPAPSQAIVTDSGASGAFGGFTVGERPGR